MYQIGSVEYGDELFHHGIKGMKWGVRRTPEELGHKPSAASNKKRIRITDASDDMLKRRTARKKLENDYLNEVKKNRDLRRRNSDQKNNNTKSAVAVALVNNIIGKSIDAVKGIAQTTIGGVIGIGKEFVSKALDPGNKW